MKFFLLGLSLFLVACSQPAAPLEDQAHRLGSGQNGRGGNAYSSGKGGDYSPSAAVGGVAASDLPPPDSASGSPPGEMRVPASGSHTQALSRSGGNGSPFGTATPPPAGAAPMSMAPASSFPGMAPNRVSTQYAPSAVAASAPAAPSVVGPSSAPPERDYYSEDAAHAKPSPGTLHAGAVSPAVAPSAAAAKGMMDSDETAPSEAAPAPTAGNQPEFIWPIQGNVLGGFGSAGGDGLDIKGKKGDPIRASSDGTVSFAGDAKTLGNCVVLDHGNGWASVYGHANELVVKKGDHVVKEQLIGFVGTSGGVGDPQLHFVIRHNGTPVDPKAILVQD